jgi:predicted DNA binding CopG/RHH family protein
MNELEKEEWDILESVEGGEWRPVRERATEMARYQGYAASTLKKDRRINIRISSQDLLALQKRAVREGIPYQTLVSSVLHKFVSGQYEERNASPIAPADLGR